MNLIYICVFHQLGYIDLLKLLITSIAEKANINTETTEFLIMTSPTFQPLIQKQLEDFNLPIHYYILNLSTLFEAGCSRLNIFNYDNIHKYDTILYLDTDILLNSDVNPIFDSNLSSDKLYALEEGWIEHLFWGGQFFDFKQFNRKKSAFTTGVLLFKNSDCIKSLFNTIQSHIVDYIYTKKNSVPQCLDQPFIVYHAISQHKYDNQLLKKYAENNPSDVDLTKIIYHFPGGPGSYASKVSKMNDFWKKMQSFIKKNSAINTSDITSIKTVNIYEDIWTCSDKMRVEIANFFMDKSHFKIAEIGAHKGYTTKILSYIFSTVYAVDNSVPWTALNKDFNKDRTNIHYIMLDIYKDSWTILPDDIDVAFIDAHHSYKSCKSDTLNSIKQFKHLKYIIFDDYGVWQGVKQLVDELINNNTLIFEQFIGLTDVPGPTGIVTNTNEGIICRVNKNK